MLKLQKALRLVHTNSLSCLQLFSTFSVNCAFVAVPRKTKVFLRGKSNRNKKPEIKRRIGPHLITVNLKDLKEAVMARL